MAKKNIATFLGTNKGLSITGEFAYAYSGGVSIDQNETTLIEYTSGNYLLVGAWQGYYFYPNTRDMRWVVYLNGAKIETYTGESSLRGNSRSQLNLIIPPHTVVKITGQNVEDSEAIEIMASITGRVYDV